MPETALPAPLLASLLFTIMGPMALIPMFAAQAGAMSREERFRTAAAACVIAAIALSIAVLAGAGAMTKMGTSRPALIIAAGLILTVQSLRAVLGLGAPALGGPAGKISAGPALSPIAIPGIASPLAVAVLVIFASYFPSRDDTGVILLVAGAIIFVNFLALCAAHRILAVIGMPTLVVLGAVFGVLQVALGVEMILDGVAAAGLLAGAPR